MTDQLPLPFSPRPNYGRLAFVGHPGVSAALVWLARQDWPGGRLALWGEAGTGKSHLLQRWAGAAPIEGAVLSWPAPPGPLAIDDADRADPAALLHVLNDAAAANIPVLLAAQTAPARWGVTLADLHSRLAAMPAVELLAGNDAFRGMLLRRLLDDWQLSVSPALQAWLLIRLPRDPAALRDAVMRLDGAAFAAQHAPTRPMAASALSDLLDDSSIPDLTNLSPGQLDLL